MTPDSLIKKKILFLMCPTGVKVASIAGKIVEHTYIYIHKLNLVAE